MNVKVGTDIVFIPRLRKVMDKTPSFFKKIYTAKEREIAKMFTEPIWFYATRFAAKEAIMKATDLQYDFREIEILKEKNGKASAKIINKPNLIIDLSLSYDGEYAVAFCMVYKKNNVDKTLS